jgi:hypothetical protein
MIGYLAVETREPLGYFGGILITDRFGLPVEFRHTLAVRPTKLQRALYGNALDRYVRAVVITERLVEGVQHEPAIILVADPLLVGDGPVPIGYLSDSGVDPVGAVGHAEPFDGASRGVLLQVRAGEAPMRLVTEAPVHLYPQIARALTEAAETMDITEPMSRVRAAVGLLASGDVAAA